MYARLAVSDMHESPEMIHKNAHVSSNMSITLFR
jgi:hypothetical protein